jgi:2-oxoglutarate ferredoxin oxidoreductase subunit delta
MTDTAKPDKGAIATNAEECKGCGLCVEACTPGVLRLAEHLNRYGYHPAIYIGHGCTACGLCFYVCPEPGGIRVYKRSVLSKSAAPVAEPVLA